MLPIHLLVRSLVVTVIASGLATSEISAKRIRTVMKPPIAEEMTASDDFGATTVAVDSIQNADSHYFQEITCAGFDKTSTNSKESFFILNSSERNILGVEIELVYYDMQHRQLHRRIERMPLDVPAGDTRKIDITSWDTQKSFHYYKSNRPSRRTSTPFDVRMTLRTLYLR